MKVKPKKQGKMSRERFEQYRSCRSHAQSDGYVHCDDCINGDDCSFCPPERCWEFCVFFQFKSNPASAVKNKEAKKNE